MVRQPEITATEKIVGYTFRCQEKAYHTTRATGESLVVSEEVGREEEIAHNSLYCDCHWKGAGETV